MKSSIIIKRFSRQIGIWQSLHWFVTCYKEVFAEAPWNEWKKCPVCQKYWGQKDFDLLASWDFRHCGAGLVDFWPNEQVFNDLNQITEKGSCWLAYDSDNEDHPLIGFCMGYPISANELEVQLGIKFGAELRKQLGNHETVAYQDDVGVIDEYRKQGVAKEMVTRRLQDFLGQNLKVGIVRTRELPEASVTFGWYRRLGYIVLARYPEGDGRVILGRNLDGLSDLLQKRMGA